MVMVSLLGMSDSSYAQTLDAQTVAGSALRFTDVRHVTAKGDGCVKQAKGVLVADPLAQTLRFERSDRVLFEIPLESIQAIHYEHTREWPPNECGPRWPWRTAHLLTIHHTGTDGQGKFQAIRVSHDDVPLLLTQLEARTGLAADESMVRGSFLGLPIHAAVGDTVYVTDDTGRTTKGILTQLSVNSMVVDSIIRRTGQPDTLREFTAAEVVKIGGNDPLWNGALNGFAAAFLPAGLLAMDQAYRGGTSSSSTWVPFFAVLASGAGIGMAIDARIKRNVYQATTAYSRGARSRTTLSSLLVTKHYKGAMVQLRF
jgi:hypothetical protein